MLHIEVLTPMDAVLFLSIAFLASRKERSINRPFKSNAALVVYHISPQVKWDLMAAAWGH